MDFTREPIIESVITPKEGYKLIVRNSTISTQEEYSVDAVEIVSFGRSFFFRSLEKPKAFLLPVSEYEIVETRETRAVLKKPQLEKPIKIGESRVITEKTKEERHIEAKGGPKKKKKGLKYRERESKEKAETEKIDIEEEKGAVASPVKRTLLPPPTGLISEQIKRYKSYLVSQQGIPAEEVGEKIAEEQEEKESIPFSYEQEEEIPVPPVEEESFPSISEEPFIEEELPLEEDEETGSPDKESTPPSEES